MASSIWAVGVVSGRYGRGIGTDFDVFPTEFELFAW